MSDLLLIFLCLLGGAYLALGIQFLEKRLEWLWRQDPPRPMTSRELYRILFLGPIEEGWLLTGIFLNLALEKLYTRLRPR